MDKNKIIEAAAKLVAKGAYDKAIKEYRRVLDADPKDVRVLQKMGELFQKKNDNVQAANYFTKVAESYSSDGFFLKAVALYKQVLKLDPNLVEINLRLAELHQQLQLMSEATAYYQLVANHHEKAGNAKASLDTLKKIIELDPENVSSRIKLAEMYARENMKADAAQEFQRAADYLKRNSRMDDYYRVTERLSALDPNDLSLARELAESFLARGDQKRALAKLQICFKADPTDIQTLTLLASAFQGLGQIAKTVSVYKEMATLHAAQNRTEEANQLWAQIEQLEPNDPDLAAKRGSRHAPAAGRVAPPPPLPPKTSSPPSGASATGKLGARPIKDQLARLLTETDVYVKYGLHDKALEHLGKIFEADPENLDAHEKAYQVYVAAANNAQAGEQLLNVLRLCTRLNDIERAQPHLNTILRENPDHPEVATFLTVLGRPVESAESEYETVPDDAILIDSTTEEIVVPDAPSYQPFSSEEDLALESASAMMSDDVIDEDKTLSLESQDAFTEEPTRLGEEPMLSDSQPVFELQAPAEAEPPDKPDTVLSATFDLEENTGEWEDRAKAGTQTFEEDAPGYELELEDEVAPPKAAKSTREEEPERDPGSAAVEECEEARFFLDQGLTEEAREILETVLIAYPGNAAAAGLLERLEQLEASQHEELAAPSPGSGHDAPSAEKTDAFDLAAELAEEIDEMDSQETSGVVSGDDFQYSVDEVFAEFKKGLEKVVKPEDVETHYDLGIAYKEMGLIDDAIGEFSVAREGCFGKKKEVDCLTMIALLQKAKGDSDGAIESYKRALMSEHAVGEMKKALEFELGAAWEAIGKPGKALFHFARVAKLDPDYRDVSSVVASLARTAKPEPDPPLSSTYPSALNGANGLQSQPAPGPGKAEEPAKSDSKTPGRKPRKAGYL